MSIWQDLKDATGSSVNEIWINVKNLAASLNFLENILKFTFFCLQMSIISSKILPFISTIFNTSLNHFSKRIKRTTSYSYFLFLF